MRYNQWRKENFPSWVWISDWKSLLILHSELVFKHSWTIVIIERNLVRSARTDSFVKIWEEAWFKNSVWLLSFKALNSDIRDKTVTLSLFSLRGFKHLSIGSMHLIFSLSNVLRIRVGTIVSFIAAAFSMRKVRQWCPKSDILRTLY